MAKKQIEYTDKLLMQKYVLRLYVAGVTPRSVQAIEMIKRLCEENLRGRYELEVIDIHQQPAMAKGDQIIAVPTLLRKLPSPLRTLIGDMSNEERVLVGLDLRPRPASPSGNGNGNHTLTRP